MVVYDLTERPDDSAKTLSVVSSLGLSPDNTATQKLINLKLKIILTNSLLKFVYFEFVFP